MTACIFCLLQVMSELTKNVAFHGSARHIMAILCELLKEAQGPHSVRHMAVLCELLKEAQGPHSVRHMAILCELLKEVQGPHSVRHMAILCELLKEAQSTQSVLGELKRLVPAQS